MEQGTIVELCIHIQYLYTVFFIISQTNLLAVFTVAVRVLDE